MFTTFTQIIRIFQQRRQRIRRNLEAARLRYARRHTYPQYERCMNCGTPLKGMYCHRCGQYALDIHQPLWKYIRQYFENMYQFDGKIWMTLRLMFTRPGFLTNEFNAGKINSYVHPFRLYKCVSVVFFAIFFMVASDRTGTALTPMSTNEVPKSLRAFLAHRYPYGPTQCPSVFLYACYYQRTTSSTGCSRLCVGATVQMDAVLSHVPFAPIRSLA